VQVAGRLDHETTLDHSERVITRLLCPRNLAPHTRYHVCLVPIYETGRLAGLGEDVPENDEKLKFAWSSDTENIRLPVYHHWSFSTGFEGDFESLARRLEAREVPDTVGTRPLDVQDPGFSVPLRTLFEHDVVNLPTPLPPFPVFVAPKVRTVNLQSALRAPGAAPPTPDGYAAFTNQLEEIVNAPAQHTGSTPIVGPTVYGHWHAAHTGPLTPSSTPKWLHTLNMDVRHRAAAGIGAEIVRERQEQLMAAAWDQVTELERVNRRLRQGQLARQTSNVFYAKHLGLHDPQGPPSQVTDTTLQMTFGVHTRLTLPQRGPTIRDELHNTTVPPAFCAPAFRRITNPRSLFTRRLMEGAAVPTDLLQRLADETVVAAGPPPRWPDGTQVVDEPVPSSPSYNSLGIALVDPADHDPSEIIDPQFDSLPTNPDESSAFQRVAGPVLAELRDIQTIAAPPPTKPRLDAIRTTLLEQLDPERTVCNRVQGRITLPHGVQWDDGGSHCSLEPVLAAPDFPEPMYRPLRDRSQDLLLAGLDEVPPNTITLAETNPEFIESYFAGLNHEMSSELLWREFPSHQRGTYFRRFWDASAALSGRENDDISPIHTWTDDLGSHLQRGNDSGQLVLLIRGELLRLFPNTHIYALRGRWKNGSREPIRPGESAFEQRNPIFRGTLEPDVTFLGFDLQAGEAHGSPDESKNRPGWFFVLEGPPTEPGFGLDETLDFSTVGRSRGAITAANPDEPWLNIAWGDLIEDQGSVSANESALDDLAYAPAEGRLDGLTMMEPGNQTSIEWGRNAAHMAYILLQLPVRLAIHADDML
jgi:hypothetical protein